MNLFTLFFAIKAKDEASEAISKLSESLGVDLKNAAAIGLTAVSAALAGITALTKKSLESYGEYEQLVGGIETLFGDSANAVTEYADAAFMTAGLSANDYMSTVTSFSATLIASLGGDTEAAAELANQALIDMSDNANKLGTDMSMIQNAYQGFAKQNYTMLDNLKLGYGGTRREMKRLIKDAAALDESIDKSSMSFDNIVRAINVVQNEMGITGTTAREAATTIQGSANMAKAAWNNLLVALGEGNGREEEAAKNLMSSLETLMSNVFPRIGTILGSMANIAPEVGVEIIEKIFENLPAAIAGAEQFGETAMEIIASLARNIAENANDSDLLGAAIKLILSLLESFSSVEVQRDILIATSQFTRMLAKGLAGTTDEVIETATAIIGTLTGGLIAASPEITVAAIEIVASMSQALMRPKNLLALIRGAIQLIFGLLEGFKQGGKYIREAGMQMINNYIEGAINYVKGQTSLKDAVSDLWNRAMEGLLEWSGFKGFFPKLWGDFYEEGILGLLFDPLGAASLTSDTINRMREVGKELFYALKNGFIEGIKGSKNELKDVVGDLFNGQVDIKAPGFISNIYDYISGSHRSGLVRVPYDGYIAELHEGERVLTKSEARSYNTVQNREVTVNVNIDGARYNDEESLAEAVARRLQRLFEDEESVTT